MTETQRGFTCDQLSEDDPPPTHCTPDNAIQGHLTQSL